MDNGALERPVFIKSWKSINDKKELYGIARRPVPNADGHEVAYFSMRITTGMLMAELTFKKGVKAAKVCLKTENVIP